ADIGRRRIPAICVATIRSAGRRTFGSRAFPAARCSTTAGAWLISVVACTRTPGLRRTPTSTSGRARPSGSTCPGTMTPRDTLPTPPHGFNDTRRLDDERGSRVDLDLGAPASAGP